MIMRGSKIRKIICERDRMGSRVFARVEDGMSRVQVVVGKHTE